MRMVIINHRSTLSGHAMFAALFITFREGLEAFLMVAIATLYLRKTSRDGLVSAVRVGLLVSVVGSAALGVVLAKVGEMSPLWEGLLALLAAAAVLWCVLHMRKMGQQMGGEIAVGLGRASLLDGPTAWWSVFGFTVLMVGREGVETATMLASLLGSTETRDTAAGAALGLGVAVVIALLWARFGRRVNLSRFFNVTSIFMIALAAMLVLKAFYEFTEIDLLPGLDNAYWHVAVRGWVKGIYAQIASVLLVLAPTVWLIAAHWLDHKRQGVALGSAA